jgi:hypothetical protein|tara:strand:+ start:3668 stop:3967 length:300 start_codon:yes stop_codon:yes gene_type:complete
MEVTLGLAAILFAGAAAYFGYRAYILAGVVADDTEYLEQLEFTHAMLLDKVRQSYDEMQRIDSKGAFESDDEAGTTFALLKQVIDNLNEEPHGPQKEEE